MKKPTIAMIYGTHSQVANRQRCQEIEGSKRHMCHVPEYVEFSWQFPIHLNMGNQTIYLFNTILYIIKNASNLTLVKMIINLFDFTECIIISLKEEIYMINLKSKDNNHFLF